MLTIEVMKINNDSISSNSDNAHDNNNSGEKISI